MVISHIEQVPIQNIAPTGVRSAVEIWHQYSGLGARQRHGSKKSSAEILASLWYPSEEQVGKVWSLTSTDALIADLSRRD
jgi:hypothetical protein